MRLYDRLLAVLQLDTGDKDILEELSPDSLKVVTAYVELSLAKAKADDKFQFERHGYCVADLIDYVADILVLNKIAGMRDSFVKLHPSIQYR